MHRLKCLTTVAAFVLLAGCATTRVPEPIREPIKPELAPNEVRSGPAPVGMRVRWGGTIVRLENRGELSVLEVVARSIDGDGRPLASDNSQGRFIAHIPGFMEPTLYTTGRLITVVGTLEDNRRGKIGEYDYVFPVVKVSEHYLWPKPRARAREPYPYPYPWYDPWYDPWYPWFGPLYPHYGHHW